MRAAVEVAGLACLAAAAFVAHLALGLAVSGLILAVSANFWPARRRRA